MFFNRVNGKCQLIYPSRGIRIKATVQKQKPSGNWPGNTRHTVVFDNANRLGDALRRGKTWLRDCVRSGCLRHAGTMLAIIFERAKP